MSDMAGDSPKQTDLTDWSRAERALMRDPVLKKVIKQIGPCTLEPVTR